jgi:hypothetical protein
MAEQDREKTPQDISNPKSTRITDKLDYRRGQTSALERAAARESFKGKGFDRHREIDWNVKFLNTGQFVQFQYNNKLRRVLVLSPNHINTSGNSVLTAIELNNIAFAPQKLGQLFRVGSLPRVVRIDAVDDTGFRYFAVSPDFNTNPQVLYDLLQTKNRTITGNYKTYYMNQLQTGVMKMFNPIFSSYVINRMNILGVE